MKKLVVPKEALSVIRLIRKKTKRPRNLPKPLGGLDRLRWDRPPFWDLTCPLGMLPNAKCRCPIGPKGTGERISSKAVRDFIEWWDNIPWKMARQAVDAVWGKKRR